MISAKRDPTSYTVEEVQTNIDNYFRLFPEMSEEVRGNREICLKVIKIMDHSNGSKLFDYCADHLKQDVSFIKDALEANFHVYSRLPKELQTRKDIVILASSFGIIFDYLNHTCVPVKPHPFLDDEEVILASFNARGEFFENKEIHDEQLFGSSFRYASNRLKKDPEFVVKAYEICQINLKKFYEKAHITVRFSYQSAHKGSNCLLLNAAPEIFEDKLFVKELLSVSYVAIKDFPEQMKKDADILLSHFWSLTDTKQLEFIDYFFKRVKVIETKVAKQSKGSFFDFYKRTSLCLDEGIYKKVCEGFTYRVQKAMNVWQDNKPSNQKAVDIYFHYI